METKIAYKPGEVPKIAAIGRTKVYDLIKTGALKARKCGGTTLIMHDDLMACLKGLPPAGPDLK
jgi:hypothetical protein